MRATEIEVIRLWIADGRAREVDSLRPDEIGAARHRDRLLDCAIIDGVLYIERQIAPSLREPMGRHLVEVYMADAIYSKNARGVSTLSAPRMGDLLGLHERTVRRIRDLLVELRRQGREQRPGVPSAQWPIIPRTLATPRISRVWWTPPRRHQQPPRTRGGGGPDTKGGTPDTMGVPRTRRMRLIEISPEQLHLGLHLRCANCHHLSVTSHTAMPVRIGDFR